MVTINLFEYVVKNNGTIDHTATLEKFSKDLSKFESELNIETKLISDAINSIFDQYPTDRILLFALKNNVLQILNVKMENYNYLSKKVNQYIMNNVGEKGKALFGFLKTKGVCRWSTYVNYPYQNQDFGRGF